jgi:membrane protein YqaA with SNARE-associated domain
VLSSPRTETPAPLPLPLSLSIEPTAREDAELERYVKQGLLKAGLLVLLLFGTLAVLGVAYEDELLAATSTLYRALGLPGLLGILFVSDAVMSPIPPDAVLVVIAKSELHGHWPLLVAGIGMMSVVAGSVGWLLGSWLAFTRVPRLLFGRGLERNERLVRRYGAWSVALGALTPIPFSLTCWTAGMLKLPFKLFAAVALLRIPRFVGYYVVIAYADTVAKALF